VLRKVQTRLEKVIAEIAENKEHLAGTEHAASLVTTLSAGLAACLNLSSVLGWSLPRWCNHSTYIFSEATTTKVSSIEKLEPQIKTALAECTRLMSTTENDQAEHAVDFRVVSTYWRSVCMCVCVPVCVCVVARCLAL